MIELGMIMMVISMLAAFALLSFGNTGEQRDASMVMSAQANLQSIVSQGAVRLDRRPDQLPTSAVLMAVQATVGQTNTDSRGITFTGTGNQFTMTINGTSRAATFEISNTGDVRLIGLSNFSNYVVDKTNEIWTIKKAP